MVKPCTDESAWLVKFLPSAGLPPLPWRPVSLDTHLFLRRNANRSASADRLSSYGNDDASINGLEYYYCPTYLVLRERSILGNCTNVGRISVFYFRTFGMLTVKIAAKGSPPLRKEGRGAESPAFRPPFRSPWPCLGPIRRTLWLKMRLLCHFRHAGRGLVWRHDQSAPKAPETRRRTPPRDDARL